MALQHQSFNDFLNTPGPSTPRGRGRGGGGRGGRGSGRGGRGASSSGGSNLKKSDYSNVPFDYASINSQRYNKMDGMLFGDSLPPLAAGAGATVAYVQATYSHSDLPIHQVIEDRLFPVVAEEAAVVLEQRLLRDHQGSTRGHRHQFMG
jgi:hypothetical protein